MRKTVTIFGSSLPKPGEAEYETEAIGITAATFNSKPNKYLTKEVKCNTLFQRIDKLIAYADAFIILPGRTETLLELSPIWELFNKNVTEEKPVSQPPGKYGRK